MLDHSATKLRTDDHRGPQRGSQTGGQAALVAVFPRPVAIPVAASAAPLGRDWLAEHGLADSEVSAAHFQLSRAGGVLHVQDAGSRNGTWLDGQRLVPHQSVPLERGAVLRVGLTALVYRPDFEGPSAPSDPLGDLVGPFGLRAVARDVAALGRNPPPNVLVEGETGTGKELLAATVARVLGRAEPYAAVNVAGVACGVFESQLFGHVAGAFSGAQRASKGIIAAHDGGAVFLDEIGELPLDLQPRLLRLLENREVLPVGAQRPFKVNVLLIAATNRDLEQMVEEGEFRRDLLARLLLARLQLPPLRERREDIFAIAQVLGSRTGLELDVRPTEVEAVERLLLEPWPSNVRELGATLAALASLDPSPGLRLWALEKVLGRARPSSTGLLSAEAVQAALHASGGNETQAARLLGVSRGKLRRFLDKA